MHLACTINWSGHNGRYGFSKLNNIIQLILGEEAHNVVLLVFNVTCFLVAIRGMAQEATQLEIEKHIMMWLRYSLDRDGGTSKRK